MNELINENKQASGKQGISVVIAVLLFSFLCQSSGVEGPALANIAAYFPETPINTIMFISTLPMFIIVPVSLVFPFLRIRFRVRTIFTIGMLLLIVGGVMPFFANSVATILIWRVIFGIGAGLMWPLTSTMAIELFQGNQRENVLGWQNTTINLGGMTWGLVGGILAAMNWRYSFLAYLLPIIILIYVLAVFPEPPAVIKKEEKYDGVKEKLPAVTFAYVLAMFLLFFASMPFFTNIAMKIQGEQIGDAATAGLAMSFFAIGGLVMGLVFGLFSRNKGFQRFSLGLGWLLCGIGYLIVGITHTSAAVVLLGAAVSGFGTAAAIASMYSGIGKVAPKRYVAFAVSMATGAVGVGDFVGPIAFNWLSAVFNQGPGNFPILSCAIFHIICAGITIIITAIPKNKSAVTDSAGM